MNSMDELGMDFPQWVTVCLCDRTVATEVAGDFTLPDYQPEIRRLLAVTPTVLPPAKYVGSVGAELNGTVDYQVLYVGGDGELYSVPLSSEYGMQAPLEQMGEINVSEGVTVFATPVCESVSARVSAPRRLNLRCRLRTRVRAYGRMAPEEQIRGTASPESIRRLLAEGRSMGVWGGVSDTVEVSTELAGMGEDVRVISASAEPFMGEIRRSDDVASASGELLLKLLLGREIGGVEVVTRRIPFTGEIDLPEAGAEGDARVSCAVSDLSVRVEEGKICCDARLLLEARCMRNQTLRYASDLYSTEKECRCEATEYRVPVALKCDMGNLSQSERMDLSELNFPEDAAIVDAWGSAILDGCEAAGGKYVLTGRSRYCFLCEKDGDYSVTEVELPLRYEVDGCEAAPESFDALANVISCRARAEGGTLSLDAEIAVIADFAGCEVIAPVTLVEFGEAETRRKSGMTVYYPADGETVWEVAKKYRVSPEALTEKKGECVYYLF